MDFLKILSVVLLISACSNTKMLTIQAGMTKEEVRATLGEPGNKQSHYGMEVWQYCSTLPNPIKLLSFGTMQRSHYDMIIFNRNKVYSVSSHSQDTHCKYLSINPNALR